MKTGPWYSAAVLILTVASIPFVIQEGSSVHRFHAGAAMAGQSARSARLVPASHAALGSSSKARIFENFGKLPIPFEPNAGQAPADVKFLSRGRGYALYLTQTGATIRMTTPEGDDQATVRMTFEGARDDVKLAGDSPQTGKSNYFLGNDSAQWYTNVPQYGRVQYRGLYRGVDLVYYGNETELEYDVVVARGADPNQVRLRFDGIERLRIDGGELVLVTKTGEMRQRKPKLYQYAGNRRVEVAGKYVIHGRDRVSFEVSGYDRTRELIIDPTLYYSTYVGGGGVDFASDVAVDAAGSVYIVGGTDSSNFPGFGRQSFQRAGFITKLSPDGVSRVYTTYIGG